MPVPKNFVIFIGRNFESRASQVGLHCRQKIGVSKGGKLRLGGQSQGCALIYGARSHEATKTWPQSTENIVQVTQPGDMLVLVS